MKVGDLVRDIVDGECCIIVGRGNFPEDFKIYRISDKHIDTRYEDELEVIAVCK